MIFFVISPAWKLFLLFFMPLLISPIISSSFETTILPEIFSLLGIYAYILWIYSVCMLINQKFSDYLNIPIHRLKLCLAYEALYALIFVLFLRNIPFRHIFPFQILSFLCGLYSHYFFSKLLVTVEKKRKIRFNEYAGTFIWVWFHIFGIWILQPRIVKIFSNALEKAETTT